MIRRNQQLIILYVLVFVAVLVSIIIHANFPTSMILFWGIPSLFLTIWSKERASKVMFFAFVATILCMAVDIIFYMTHQWYVVSAFNHRLLGIVAWEDIPYFFLWIYFPVIFWEHFYEKQIVEPKWTRKMTLFTCVVILFFIIVFTMGVFAPWLVQKIPYFYLIGLIIFGIIPITLELLFHPKLRMKFIRLGLYFAFSGMAYELTALYLKQWYYPSTQFIGWVEIINLRFPIEEFFAWILLGSTIILSWYEYLDDQNP